MKSILVVSDNYPSFKFPTRGIFVYKLVQQFTRTYDVDVISPSVIFKGVAKNYCDYGVDNAKVIYPYYLSFSNTNRMLNKISYINKKLCISLASIRLSKDYAFIYAHFLQNGLCCFSLKKKFKCPLIVSLGESNITKYEQTFSLKFLKKQARLIDGYVAVSNKIMKYCIDALNVPIQKILYAPNGVNLDLFKPNHQKKQLRKKFNIPEDKFVVSFLGSFIKRKGFDSLLSALHRLDEVFLVAIGKGTIEPNDRVLFAGVLMHKDVPDMLNATDIFVFPTRAEGSSNAIIEAMACGLPVITSDIPEISEHIGKDNAILINPENIDQLAIAIRHLKENREVRESYSKRSERLSKTLCLQNRTRKICDWATSLSN